MSVLPSYTWLWDSGGHWEEVVSLPEGAEPEGTAIYRRGEGSCVPTAVSRWLSKEGLLYLWLGQWDANQGWTRSVCKCVCITLWSYFWFVIYYCCFATTVPLSIITVLCTLSLILLFCYNLSSLFYTTAFWLSRHLHWRFRMRYMRVTVKVCECATVRM